MKKFISLLGSGLLCLLVAVATHAQGVGSSGDIKGTVTDPNGATLPNAAIAVVGTETGLRRTAMTDADSKATFGYTHYREQLSLNLTSLTPLR